MAVRPELLKNIRTVDPYVPGEQPRGNVVKLNTNENPYPPAPGVKRRWTLWIRRISVLSGKTITGKTEELYSPIPTRRQEFMKNRIL